MEDPPKLTWTEADWNGHTIAVETFTNEFWTSKQRAANSLHEISYRACFKPQLVDFFVERLTDPGDLVYDPFYGARHDSCGICPLGQVSCRV